MLSISNMTSEQAAHYHAQDQNYYQSEKNETDIWQGQGANQLGLNGSIDIKQFERLCHGIHPHEEKVLVDTTKRAGTDLTFSTPKSVSVLVELSNEQENKALRTAHDDAVTKTLQFVEKYAQTREQINGYRTTVDTNNLVIAKFQHDTSRELDPQLHTHSFVLNMTQKESGDWRALHNDNLFTNKMLFGQIYRNELAQNIQKLGYEVEVINAKQGLWEIKDFNKNLLEEFSQRSKQVQKKFEELKEKFPQIEDAKLKEMAALDSRKSKNKNTDRKEVKKENIERAKNICDINSLVQDLKVNNEVQNKEDTQNILDTAKEIITDKESVFTKEELLKESLRLSIQSYRLDDFIEAIDKDLELINIEKNIYTTQKMIEIEQNILDKTKEGLNTYEALVEDKSLDNFIESKYQNMTKGQKRAFKHILSNEDMTTAIQGDAGTGKTYMLKAVNEYIENNNTQYSIVGLAYTGKASAEIEKDSGIKSKTLHSFLNQKEFQDNQIYVIDEASMIGSKQLQKLQNIATNTNSKIILLGDRKQYQSIQAGGIFEKLQQHNALKTVYMTEGMRANTDVMKSLYKDIKTKELESAFNTLVKNEMIKEGISFKDISKEYIENRKDILLLVSKNSDKEEFNNLIRDGLKKDLQDNRVIKIKEAINLDDIEKHYSISYQKDQLVFFNKGVPGARAGFETRIIDVNHEDNKLLLQKSNDEILEVDLNKYGSRLSSFNSISKEFATNEKIIFTKNNNYLGVKNGQIGTITDIDKNNNLKILHENKKEITINLNEYNYIDYGYAITDYKAQGQTAKNVIAVANSDMATTNSFYVQVTRAKDNIQVFTDDIEKLKEKTTTQQIKTSTLDYLENLTIKTTKEDIKDEKRERGTATDLLGEYGKRLGEKLGSISRDTEHSIKEAGEQWRENFKGDLRVYGNELKELRVDDQELTAVQSLTEPLNQDYIKSKSIQR